MSRRLLAPLAALILLAAAPARGREEPRPALAVTPLVGAFLPAGHAQAEFENAVLVGLQASWDLDPALALVGTFAEAPSAARELDGAALDIWQYDLGLRLQHAFVPSPGLSLRPSAGIGFGYRHFAFRDPQYQGGAGCASYASTGVELGYRALSAGVAGRFEVFTPEGDALGDEAARTDFKVFGWVGLRF
jgi:hypothetical protein